MDCSFNFESWENHMLEKGFPKPFLKNIAVGSVVTLQSSFVKITKSKTADEILDETQDLKANAKKFGLKKLDTLSDTLSEQVQQEGEIKGILIEMAKHLKNYKNMVKENCSA